MKNWIKIILLVALPILLIGSIVSTSYLPSKISLAATIADPRKEEDTFPPSQLVTKDASALVLAIADFEPGWRKVTAEQTTKEGAQSAYYVCFGTGSKQTSLSVIWNTVAVYPNIDLAQQTYFNEKPVNISLDDPKIGDESFLDVSDFLEKRLVFRKANVVVWLQLQLCSSGAAKSYARIIERKIGPEVQPKTETPPPAPEPKKEDEDCFIATAAYGTPAAQEIDILREFRDEVLLNSVPGTRLVHLYYRISPPIAETISEHNVLGTLAKELLVDPIVIVLERSESLWSK